ncbi:hypothetical protein MKZ38_008980 [Zalerion maritima]|uniref:NACHT domain-containing protein n=1 Tax=Zalerion maritima TaxID=339359 RepID=A0AAD5RGA0_9PEZI|nr:hypothetical protein MKZ38_008980 [Zalerion maritima]
MDLLVKAGLKKTEKEAAAKPAAPQAAVAWASICFALQIFENPVHETLGNRDGITYIISRINWYWNLSSLLFEENEADGKFTGLEIELKKRIVDLYKMLFSYQIKSVCLYYRNRGLVLLRNVVKFDDWDEALQSIKNAEGTVRYNSKTCNTQHIRDSLGRIARNAESQDEKKNKDCLLDLLVTDPRDDKNRIKQTKGELFPEASNWILRHSDFCRWHHGNHGSFLWVKGDPGEGKTMLFTIIIEELEQQLKQLRGSTKPNLSYVFCQATNSNLKNPTAVLKGLIYLLCVHNPPLVSCLRKRYNTSGAKLFKGDNIFFALSQVFEDMLRDDSLMGKYILVDVLNECKYLDQLLPLITNNTTALSRVKRIISSRNWATIEQQLGRDDLGTKLSLELTQNAEQVRQAVNAYIDFKVKDLPSLQNDIEERNRVRDSMRQKANGTFLWVALVIEQLKKADPWDLLKVVDGMPANLTEIYNRILNQIT